MLSSYPTYEEWKLQIWLLVNINSICSYPTYEEWKLEREIYYIEVQAVLILPMRNKKQRDAHIARLYNLIINNGYNMFL